MAERFELLKHAYAHRGLWGVDGPSENSMRAYKAAASAKVGMEMDVRPSLDGTPICFHDPTLSRMTPHEGFVSDYTTDALTAFKLNGGETIPTLSDLLSSWPHDLPLIVEMKIDGDTNPAAFAKRVSSEVAAFPGLAAIISFNFEAVASIEPGVMRGQLVPPSYKIDDFSDRLERALASDVEFLALNVVDAEASIGAKLPTVCWTVREPAHRERVQRCGHAEIFEHLPIPLAAAGDTR